MFEKLLSLKRENEELKEKLAKAQEDYKECLFTFVKDAPVKVGDKVRLTRLVSKYSDKTESVVVFVSMVIPEVKEDRVAYSYRFTKQKKNGEQSKVKYYYGWKLEEQDIKEMIVL